MPSNPPAAAPPPRAHRPSEATRCHPARSAAARPAVPSAAPVRRAGGQGPIRSRSRRRRPRGGKRRRRCAAPRRRRQGGQGQHQQGDSDAAKRHARQTALLPAAARGNASAGQRAAAGRPARRRRAVAAVPDTARRLACPAAGLAARRRQPRCCATHSRSWPRGRAPILRSTGLPSLNRIIVGMPRTSLFGRGDRVVVDVHLGDGRACRRIRRRSRPGSAPPCGRARNHSAQKSTRTGPGACSTSCWKLSSVTALVSSLIGIGPRIAGVCRRPPSEGGRRRVGAAAGGAAPPPAARARVWRAAGWSSAGGEGIQQRRRQRHHLRAVGPYQHRCHLPPGEGSAQQGAIGGHLPQQRWRHRLCRRRRGAIGLEVQSRMRCSCTAKRSTRPTTGTPFTTPAIGASARLSGPKAAARSGWRSTASASASTSRAVAASSPFAAWAREARARCLALRLGPGRQPPAAGVDQPAAAEAPRRWDRRDQGARPPAPPLRRGEGASGATGGASGGGGRATRAAAGPRRRGRFLLLPRRGPSAGQSRTRHSATGEAGAGGAEGSGIEGVLAGAGAAEPGLDHLVPAALRRGLRAVLAADDQPILGARQGDIQQPALLLCVGLALRRQRGHRRRGGEALPPRPPHRHRPLRAGQHQQLRRVGRVGHGVGQDHDRRLQAFGAMHRHHPHGVAGRFRLALRPARRRASARQGSSAARAPPPVRRRGQGTAPPAADRRRRGQGGRADAPIRCRPRRGRPRAAPPPADRKGERTSTRARKPANQSAARPRRESPPRWAISASNRLAGRPCARANSSSSARPTSGLFSSAARVRSSCGSSSASAKASKSITPICSISARRSALPPARRHPSVP